MHNKNLSRNRLCLLLSIVIIGLLFVIRLIFSLGNNHALFIDITSYEEYALRILDNGYMSINAYHPPAYPTFIALCYLLFGRSLISAYIVQTLLASVSLFLIYKIAERLLNPGYGLAIVAAYALYLPLTLYSGVLLAETLFIFLLILGIYAFISFIETQRYLHLSFSAFSFALSALTRSINQLVIFLIPLFLLFLILITRRSRKEWQESDIYERALKNMPIKRALISGVVFVGIFAATLAPWTIRNVVLFKEFIPVDTLGGLNLLVGNNEYAQGVYVTLSDQQLEDMIKRYTGEDQPLKIRYSNGLVNLNDKALRDAGISYILNNPGRFIKLTIKRAGLFMLDDFRGLDWVLKTHIENNTILNASSLIPLIEAMNILFFILSVFGLPLLIKNRRTRWFALIILYYWGTTSCFYITSRYRMPIIPFMAISAGMLLYALTTRLLKRRQRIAGISGKEQLGSTSGMMEGQVLK